MTYHGLTDQEVRLKRQTAGLNTIEAPSANIWKKFRRWVLSPITGMLVLAALFSFVLNKIFDVYFILFLALLNIGVGFWHEKKADDAIEKLKKTLAVKTKTLRNGAWQIIDSLYLVPEDIIRLEMGDVIPADAQIIEERNASINESALTGESLPKEKAAGEKIFAGTFLSTGYAIAKITAIASQTAYGKTIRTAEEARKRSLLEEDILSITKYLTVLSLASVILLTIFFLFFHKPLLELLTLNLSLIIAGIPISLPTVMTLIISFGVLRLAKKHAIVRNISSLENLSNVDMLLADKTGTLTQNKITVRDIIPSEGRTKEESVQYAYFANIQEEGPVRDAIREYLEKNRLTFDAYAIEDFIPHDSDRKRSTAVIRWRNARYTVTFGAPQVVADLSDMTPEALKRFMQIIEQSANEGYRPISVAISKDHAGETRMTIVGTLLFSDILREDSKDVIGFLRTQGIETKIVTGDNRAISKKIAKELGLTGAVLDRATSFHDGVTLTEAQFAQTSVFSEILPVDKYHLVEFAKKSHVVAVTGDGVNDIPSVKAADVGISVKNGVAALRSAADIVILKDSIAVIKDAIIEARKIFSRLYSYAIYRISESFRIIFNILIIGLLYKEFPLLPIHLIILALLNDIPIISLAFDRVSIGKNPAKVNARKRLFLGTLYGLVGVVNSLLFFFIAYSLFHFEWGFIQTMFFLKLSVSGHLLIYVAHTKERWFRYLPSKEVIGATTATQLIATAMAIYGFLMTPITWEMALFVWLWAIAWMQITELMKIVHRRISWQ